MRRLSAAERDRERRVKILIKEAVLRYKAEQKAKAATELAEWIIVRAGEFGLTPCETRAVAEVARDEQAWRTRESLAWCPEAVVALESRGVLEPWDDCPDGPAVTFTPWGASVLGLAVVERWERVEASEIERVAPGAPLKTTSFVGVVEVPKWDDAGRAAHRPPLAPLKYAREVPLPSPDSVPDPKAGPELVLDEVSGKPVELFFVDWAGKGIPITIDRRLKTGARSRPESVRRSGR